MTLAEQLRRDEGERLMPYTDSTGNLTIGVGRNLTANGISKAESDFMLSNDIADAEAKLRAALPWTDQLDDARRGVLLNMTFNMGIRGLLSFHATLGMVQAGDYAAAAADMLQSEWAQQVGDRARRLAQQMETGEWV